MSDETQNQETPELTAEEQVDKHNVEMIQKQIDAGRFTLPEQFETPEELIKAYKNIQGQATRATQENARLKENQEAVEQVDKDADPAAPVTDMAKELLKPANEGVKTSEGLDWAAIDTELKGTGDLSEGTRKAMEEGGIPADLIKAKVDNYKRQVADGAAEAAEIVGGQEQLKELLAWGNQNLSEQDQAVLADQLNGPGWKLALMGLKALRGDSDVAPHGNEPKTEISGGPGQSRTTKPQPFVTQAEMGHAMRDPRYGREKEYTEQVMARMLASQGTLINATLVDKRTRKFG